MNKSKKAIIITTVAILVIVAVVIVVVAINKSNNKTGTGSQIQTPIASGTMGPTKNLQETTKAKKAKKKKAKKKTGNDVWDNIKVEEATTKKGKKKKSKSWEYVTDENDERVTKKNGEYVTRKKAPGEDDGWSPIVSPDDLNKDKKSKK